MKKLTLSALLSLLFLTGVNAQSIWNPEHLKVVKASLSSPVYSAAYQQLLDDADNALTTEPLSVMMKEKTPASGDKHDYMSQARYFWPDPTKPDGLPYINRDGESNPELEKLDRVTLGRLADRVTALSLAWYFSGDERYAQRATEFIRVWFFNEDTRMNPNLNYAQMIPGHNEGRGRCYGVIDTYSFVDMLDAVQLLKQSRSFTTADEQQLQAWFGQLTQWLLTSEQALEEGRQLNNHSIAYDTQLIAFALYAGNTDAARQIIQAFPARRMFAQIEPDGKQPHELTRTLAFGYSQFNLSHMVDVFLMAQKIGITIDDATSPDGRNFYRAVDFLTPYLGKPVAAWPYQQISEWDYKQQELCKDLYRLYTLRPARTDYLRLYEANKQINPADRFHLLYVEAR